MFYFSSSCRANNALVHQTTVSNIPIFPRNQSTEKECRNHPAWLHACHLDSKVSRVSETLLVKNLSHLLKEFYVSWDASQVSVYSSVLMEIQTITSYVDACVAEVWIHVRIGVGTGPGTLIFQVPKHGLWIYSCPSKCVCPHIYDTDIDFYVHCELSNLYIHF